MNIRNDIGKSGKYSPRKTYKENLYNLIFFFLFLFVSFVILHFHFWFLILVQNMGNFDYFLLGMIYKQIVLYWILLFFYKFCRSVFTIIFAIFIELISEKILLQ